MAEDDLNEVPKQAEGEVSAEKTAAPKKKAVRKKTPQANTAAKKKVSVKKKAAPKKKAARKSGIAASKSTSKNDAAELPAVNEASAPAPEKAPDQPTAAENLPESDASAAVMPTGDISVSSSNVEAASAAVSEEPAQEAAPKRNENVQKRLEEMGLMPPDSTEKQTPPPAKRTGSGLGFWQKSFIWAIVIVAGLLYLRTVNNPGNRAGDEMASSAAPVDKTAQVADNPTTDVTPNEPPVAAVDSVNANALAMTESDKGGAQDMPSVAANAAGANAPATDMTSANAEEKPGLAENQPAQEGTVIVPNDQVAAGQSVAATEPSAVPTTEAAGETGQTAVGEAVVAGSSPASAESVPQTVANAGAEEASGVPLGASTGGGEPLATTPSPDQAGNLPQMPGMASRYGGAGMSPMWSNPQQPMMPMMQNRFATAPSSAPAESTSEAAQTQSGKQNPSQQSAPMGQRYSFPYRRGFINPGYPWGVNPPVAPYYWPYPPRPPVYGPVVRYPYYYPQVPR
ncbi:hypothetical protein [Sedimenticola sp.]|uniref:hypothetical protein n=1 Tax=Sedimenticola sp. TaxID=1940285 RepID=UPI003D0B8D76